MEKSSKLIKHKTQQNIPWDYFDDCAICQGMKQAKEQGRNLGETELKALFAKQNKRNKQN